MNRRLHLGLLLVASFCVLWVDLPDAMAPLILAIPFFALSVFSRSGVQVVDFASIIGLLGFSAAIWAFVRTDSVRLLWAKIGLAISAVLFVAASRPLGDAALSVIPFAVLAVWPTKREGPNKALEPTPGPVTPHASSGDLK